MPLQVVLIIWCLMTSVIASEDEHASSIKKPATKNPDIFKYHKEKLTKQHMPDTMSERLRAQWKHQLPGAGKLTTGGETERHTNSNALVDGFDNPEVTAPHEGANIEDKHLAKGDDGFNLADVHDKINNTMYMKDPANIGENVVKSKGKTNSHRKGKNIHNGQGNVLQTSDYDPSSGNDRNTINGISRHKSNQNRGVSKTDNHVAQQDSSGYDVTNDKQANALRDVAARNNKHDQSTGAPAKLAIRRVDERINQTHTELKMSSGKGTVHKTHDKLGENTCVLIVGENSVSNFRHVIYYGQFNYVYLHLVTPSNVNIQGSKRIVGEKNWIWTYYGTEGAVEFLKWPVEFGIWSLGLLNTYVFGQVDIELEYVRGDCSRIAVGETASDLVISKALVNLTTALMAVDPKYGPSFYCHKERMFIKPHSMYTLCKHMVCPVEALKFSCCSYFYKQGTGREASCSYNFGQEQEFEYDSISWTFPTIIGTFLFAFSPLLLMYLSWRSAHWAQNYFNRPQNQPRNHVQNAPSTGIIFMNGKRHVTCLNTIFGGVFKSIMPQMSIISRLVRFTIPFMSLSLIALQILIDKHSLEGFVIESTKKGVPMGFRSMLAGYHVSSLNFLAYIGGPFIACAIYLAVTCAAMTIPTSIADVLVSGLRDCDTPGICVTQQLTIRLVEKYGSVPIRSRTGYHKVYSFLLGRFYMTINITFWKFIGSLQLERWQNLNRSKFWLALYIPVCVFEIILCLALYCLPIVSFGALIIRSYRGFLYGRANRSFGIKIIVKIIALFLIIAVCFSLFMFCTIFLDAALFTARIMIFTYTGVVVYPKESYGYIIFFFMVIYYLWDCFMEFSNKYQRLLKLTISVCEAIQREQAGITLVVTEAGFKGVAEGLFEHVIESHSPRRKQMLVSSLKVVCILGLMWLSLGLLTQGDRFRELHVIMHVFTAIFICVVPKVLKYLCSQTESRFQTRRLKNEIKMTINEYLGYFADPEIYSDYEHGEAE